MFTKPSKVITVDTLIGMESISAKSNRRKSVITLPKKKEAIVVKASPPMDDEPTVVPPPVITKVDLSSCFKESHTDGASITWVGDRI